MKVEAQVHRLLAPRAALGKVLERRKSLVEAGRGFAVRAPPRRLGAGLLEEQHGLVPQPALERVVGEAIHLLGKTAQRHALDDRDETGMQGLPLFVQERAVGDLVSQRVLEGVLEIGKEARLVDELR